MLVRIRITGGPRAHGAYAGLASLLTLGAVACFIMGAWKILADLGWAGQFVLAKGVFSHWQVWMAGCVVAQLVSFRLTRRRPLIS